MKTWIFIEAPALAIFNMSYVGVGFSYPFTVSPPVNAGTPKTVRSTYGYYPDSQQWANGMTLSDSGVNEGGLAVMSDGTLYGIGANNYGRLGTGDTTYKSSWTQVGSESNWAYCFNGLNPYGTWSSFVTKTDGTLYTCGWNDGGLGVGDTISHSTLVQVPGWNRGLKNVFYTTSAGGVYLLHAADGTIWGCGNAPNWGPQTYGSMNVSTPVQIGSTSYKRVAAAGSGEFVLLTNDGALYAWGCGTSGWPFGIGYYTAPNRSVMVQLASDTTFTDAVNTGPLGGPFSSGGILAVTTDGRLLGWGGAAYHNSMYGDASPTVISSSGAAILMSAGGQSVCMLKPDDTLWSMGQALYDGSTVSSYFSPVLLMSNVKNAWFAISVVNNSVWGFYATKTDGTLWCGGTLHAYQNTPKSIAQVGGTAYNISAVIRNSYDPAHNSSTPGGAWCLG